VVEEQEGERGLEELGDRAEVEPEEEGERRLGETESVGEVGVEPGKRRVDPHVDVGGRRRNPLLDKDFERLIDGMIDCLISYVLHQQFNICKIK
jgi:hypothetical protein